MSGAVARKGANFALIANTRIKVGNKGENGILDNYPGFEVDARKVSLRTPSACSPYGIPPGCSGANCRGGGSLKTVTVGGTCDTQIRPVAGVL